MSVLFIIYFFVGGAIYREFIHSWMIDLLYFVTRRAFDFNRLTSIDIGAIGMMEFIPSFAKSDMPSLVFAIVFASILVNIETKRQLAQQVNH